LGDCLDAVTGLCSLPDKSVDHVICDPPYGDETHLGARGGQGDTKLVTFGSITAEELRTILGEVGRVTRRWVVATVEWRHVLPLERNPPNGLRFVRHGIWVKPNGAPQFTGDRPATGWEAVAILHAAVPEGRMKWNGGGKHAVWNFPKEGENVHPTQKPIALADAFVRDFTDPGDLILDPFAGSGTTGVAAIRLGRRFLGWEKDPKYHAAAVKRLAGTREQLVLGVRGPKPKQGTLL
jgi:site-specific DNA-methyltransferase (adenine-specific)